MQFLFTRIGLLLKKQWIENSKFYLLSALAMMGTMGLVFLLISYNNNSGLQIGAQLMCLGIGLISFGSLFALTVFSKLDKKEDRLMFFMNPASALEKIICGLTFCAVVFPIVYLLAVYPVLCLANYVDGLWGHQNKLYTFWEVSQQSIKNILLSLFYLLQALVLLFSLYFRKYKTASSIAMLCLLFFGSMWLYSKIINSTLPHYFKKEINLKQIQYFDNKEVIKYVKIKEFFSGEEISYITEESRWFSDNRYIAIDMPFRQQVWFYILFYLSIPFMWLIAWFRLRESEIS